MNSAHPGFLSRRRSKLRVLATDFDSLREGAASGADIVQLDHPRASTLDGAGHARSLIRRALDEVDWDGCEVWVELYPLETGLTQADVDAFVAGRADVLILPYSHGPEDIVAVAGWIDQAERRHGVDPGSVLLATVIERLASLSRVEEIGAAHERMTFMSIGLTGLAEEFGYVLDKTGASPETLFAKSRLILAARLAGIDVGESPYLFESDLDGAVVAAERAFRLGFSTKSCVSARQVAAVHRAYDSVHGA